MSVISSFGLLSQEKIQTTKRLSSFLGALGFGATNALYELILGIAPPAGQYPLFIPHDHCEYGIALPRASVYSHSTDESDNWGFSTTGSDYYHYHRGGTPDSLIHSADTRGNGCYDIALYVTPNMTALEAKVLADINNGDASFRFHNRTTNTQSSAIATTGTGMQWVSFTDIPVKAGAWNQIDFEAKSTSSSDFIYVIDMNIAETRNHSQPSSDGVNILTSLTKP